ncbi:protein kinase family protein [Virgibacillus sp. DJP39]|uniref:protein kinase family protein n=1 Tax=Virgibacillus sp. DJP39 TaxID=3409790 RepID=UPI003BB4A3F6
MQFLKLFKRVLRGFTDHQYGENETIYDKYKVKAVLGMGSYGMTYLCENVEEKQLCVVKQMTKSKKKTLIRKQYQTETEILEQLSHPNIPRFYERFTFENNNLFSMEYIEGENLEDLIFSKKKRFNEKESLVLIRDLLHIVSYIHTKGIIHGDLRIPNVMIRNGEPCIIDFGLSEPCSVKNKDSLPMEDFFDLGDLLLFLLYSSYNSTIKKGRPWTEELSIHERTSQLLKNLLGVDESYTYTSDVLHDVNQAIESISN